MRVCPSVGPSVGPLVHWSVARFFQIAEIDKKQHRIIGKVETLFLDCNNLQKMLKHNFKTKFSNHFLTIDRSKRESKISCCNRQLGNGKNTEKNLEPSRFELQFISLPFRCTWTLLTVGECSQGPIKDYICNGICHVQFYHSHRTKNVRLRMSCNFHFLGMTPRYSNCGTLSLLVLCIRPALRTSLIQLLEKDDCIFFPQSYQATIYQDKNSG